MRRQIIVTSLLILGGAAVTKATTGININLASFLIPLGVIMYTLAGGLKATFIASWVNISTIMIALCVLIFKVYATAPELGSVSQVWERLIFVTTIAPVPHNKDGSYLTILSRDGFFFGLVNIVANFGTVFVDQSYWMSAIAATPSSAWPGYMLSGITWFGIPFALATAAGLGGVALSLPISVAEANAGLVPPAVAYHLMGNSGAILIFIMVFSAVTSSGASQMIAVSSIVSYDIYRTYIDPNASGQRVIFISRIVILIYGLAMGVLGIVFNQLNVTLGFLYNATAVFVSPALVPVIYSISWGRASAKGASCGAIGGLIVGVTVWLAYGSSFHGGVSVANLDQTTVHLAGALASIGSSFLITTGLSLYDPDDCDWSTTRAITLIEDDPNSRLTYETEAELRGAFRKNAIIAGVVTLLLLVVWPLLAIAGGVFSLSYFTFWVYMSMAWGLASTIILVALPLWESRQGIVAVATFGRVILSRPQKQTGRDMDDISDDFVADER
jgi:urea-proton symporter